MSVGQRGDDRPFYFRLRGRTLGPFTLQQMRQKAAAAQINSRSDISRDGFAWSKAAEFPEIFSGGGAPPGGSTSGVTPPITTPQPEWYCQLDGNQHGPLELAAIQQYVASGTLGADDYVFRVGQQAWTRVHENPELANSVAPPPPAIVVDQRGSQNVSAEVFCRECGAGLKRLAVICPSCGVPTQAAAAGAKEKKSKYVAATLAFLLGGLGIHHFYLGNAILGVIYLLFCWTLVPALIAFVEAIIYLAMPARVFDQKYNAGAHPAA
jgi:TM2 domain-containing membrane protein YozV